MCGCLHIVVYVCIRLTPWFAMCFSHGLAFRLLSAVACVGSVACCNIRTTWCVAQCVGVMLSVHAQSPTGLQVAFAGS